MRTLPGWAVAVGATLILLYMLVELPAEAATVRAVDIELGLHLRCRDGDVACCEARLLANDKLRTHVIAATQQISTAGPRLFAGEEGIALLCDENVVLDIAGRASRLLQR